MYTGYIEWRTYMIKRTDICISKEPAIYVSRQLVYGERKRPSSVDCAKTVIKKSVPILSKLLDLPNNLIFRLSRTKGTFSGKYNHDERTVWIDPNYAWDRILETLAHELVHAEQYNQKRLEAVFLAKKGWVYQWNGELSMNKGSTYTSYRKQPWEKEAYNRQKKLADQVCDMLEELQK